MNTRERFSLLLTIGLLLGVIACSKQEAAKLESESTTKSTDAQGNETVTTTDVKQVGSTLVGETKTTVETSGDDKTTETLTVVGTVTSLERGDTIQVLTGTGKRHDFDLDDDDTTVTMDPAVVVGTKVKLVRTEYDDGRKTIRVDPVLLVKP